MSKDGDGKTKYEAPVVIALGELAGAVCVGNGRRTFGWHTIRRAMLQLAAIVLQWLGTAMRIRAGLA